jgi:hypothetical protein
MSIEIIAPASRPKSIMVRVEPPEWQEYLLY